MDFQTFQQITWIPEKFAILGQNLKLKDDTGNWADGWIIQHVGSRRSDKENLDQTYSLDFTF